MGIMIDRFHTLPEDYTPRIEELLKPLGRSLAEPKKLAADILRLSTHYNDHPEAKSPWREPWAQAASLVYFFPLNYSRARAVALEALRLGFFAGIDSVFDFGSGMGSAVLALRDVLAKAKGEQPALKLQCMDVSAESLRLGRELAKAYPALADLTPAPAPPELKPERLMVLASYAYTELEEVPSWWLEAEALFIIEPSTQSDGRRLMALREKLLTLGHHVWAPCTHAGHCPLFSRSETDWCHDRIHFEGPSPWWPVLERELPIKNRTLTFSYLLARKTRAAPKSLRGLTRVTGDRLEEKGKNRQSICRGPEREFLTWFPQRLKLKKGELEFGRGHLARVADGLERKGAENSLETRLRSREDIEVLAPEIELEMQPETKID